MKTNWHDLFMGLDEKERTSALIQGLSSAFSWDESKESPQFWKGVILKLSTLTVNPPIIPKASKKAINWDSIFIDHNAQWGTPEGYKRRASIVANALGAAFVWRTTAEGDAYWRDIYHRLLHLELKKQTEKTGPWWDSKLPKRID